MTPCHQSRPPILDSKISHQRISLPHQKPTELDPSLHLCLHLSWQVVPSHLWFYPYNTHEPCFVERYREYLFFRWKIKIYFIEWTPSVIFSWMAAPLMKIFPMVFTRWNKFRSFTEKNPKYSVYFMLSTLSGRSFIKIQYSSFPLFPLAYPFRIATHYIITSSVRNVR